MQYGKQEKIKIKKEKKGQNRRRDKRQMNHLSRKRNSNKVWPPQES